MTDPSQSQGIEAQEGGSEVFGRYVLHAPIARGGMATVHIARLVGAEGFSRIVAAKRLHEQYTEDQDFVTMFLDEARIASKIHHPNVVPVLDVVLSGAEVILVQEYVHGVPLDKLVKAARDRGQTVPPNIAVAIVAGILSGLQAAHDTTDEMGEPLNIVHRDVSPQNIIVSADGIPRLLDFGIAKARSSAHVTQEGFFKGKITYIPPEQLKGEPPARTTDIYAAGVVLWELAVGRRLHAGKGESELFSVVLNGVLPTVLDAVEDQRARMPPERYQLLQLLDPVVMQALALDPKARFPTAAAMAEALARTVPPASSLEVGAWVRALGSDFLEGRQRLLTGTEESWRSMAKVSVPTSGSGPSVTPSGVKAVFEAGRERTPTPQRRIVSGVANVAETTDLPYPPPQAQESSMRKYGIVALLGLLFLVGLFVVLRTTRSSPVEQPVAPAIAAPQDTQNGTVAVPVVTGQSATPAAAPSASAAPPASVAARASAMPVAAQHPVGRVAPPPPPRPTHAAAPPPHVDPPPPAPAPAATPAPNCNPPFYFEGTKKVFKPGCI